MRPFIFLLLLALATPRAEAQRQVVGIFSKWGAFKQESRRGCYAIAQPVGMRKGEAAFASVLFGRGGPQVHLRLGQPARVGSSVIVRIDGEAFTMQARGSDAWAGDARADAAMIAAMRGAGRMSVETRAENGARLRYLYALTGAASAIDAAAAACAPRG